MRSGGFHAKNGASVWKDLEFVLSPSDEERKRAAGLVEEVEAGLPVERTQSSLLRMSDPSAAAFFSILADRRSRESRCELETGSSWMLRADFCFVNVRATGIDGRPGDFIAASKLLPGITASAVHLAPFHPYQFEVLYAIEDPYEIAEELVNIELASAGIGPLAQLRAFMEACRLLDKVIGYDLTPHVAQYSRVVLDSPEAFAWIKLAPDRNSVLEGGHPYERIARIGTAREAAGVIARVKGKTGFERFSREAAGPVEATNASGKPIGQELKERSLATRAYYEAIRDLIAEGLWPVPTQAWDGIGLPEFARYDREGNYPVFLYRNERGDDVSSHSYGVVTPYAFYDNIPPNKAPDPGKLPELGPRALEAYSGVFAYWRDLLGFDFVRFDSVDHVFDSTLDSAGTLPATDRPTPLILARAIDAARTDGHDAIGAFAERIGTEFEDYSGIGFDLVLGDDMLRRIDRPHLDDAFALHDRLVSANAEASRKGGRRASVCFAVDTHDTGDPRLWGSPLVRVMGYERVGLRHFVARFLSVGAGRRPLYETMGYQDLSYGLYEANISPENLIWVDDTAAAARYACIERVYARIRPFLDSAKIVERQTGAELAWWIIRGSDPSRVVACAASLETADGNDLGRFLIPTSQIESGAELQGRMYDFSDPAGEPYSIHGDIVVEHLPFLGFRVFDLNPEFF